MFQKSQGLLSLKGAALGTTQHLREETSLYKVRNNIIESNNNNIVLFCTLSIKIPFSLIPNT